MRAVWLTFSLAWRDYRHEWLMSLCAVCALAAVLTPLLVLFGVRFGVVSALTERLVEEPRNRAILPVGSGRFDRAFVARWASQPEVAFVIPETRSIAATITLLPPNGGEGFVVDLLPSGPGDPVLQRCCVLGTDMRTIVLSAGAARQAGLAKGAETTGRVGRFRAGRREQSTIGLTIAGVLPEAVEPRTVAYVPAALASAIEDYRDGFAVDALGWTGDPKPAGERLYPSFRMVARSIEDVAGLAQRLRAEGIEVHTQAAAIDSVLSLDRAFAVVFQAIALVAVIGYVAATQSNLLAMVARKGSELGTLALVGFPRAALVMFPVAQSLLTGLFGALLALGAYKGVESAINGLFAAHVGTGEQVCVLLPLHAALTLALALCVAIVSAAGAAWRAARVEPAQALRDV